jgi:dTDP-4-dehydrorhamnose reductase
MSSVLVLGATGMLGSTVVHRLRALHPSWRVEAVAHATRGERALEAEAGRPGIADLLRTNAAAFVVNCTGVLKVSLTAGESVERAIRVNALFPHELADVAGEFGVKVIHISTDAVFSGRQRTPYAEDALPDPRDVYGMSKALGESRATNALNLRCSIVGRDRRGSGLLEWYLGATEPVGGYSDYVWTPSTTVQVADVCARLIDDDFDAARSRGHVMHVAPNAPLSKEQFLRHVRAFVGKGAAVEAKTSTDGPCYRVLASRGSSTADAGWPALLSELFTEFSTRGR